MRSSLEVIRKIRGIQETLGAEIGVALGDNASDILKSWPEVKLLLIDSYFHSLEWSVRSKERMFQFNDRITWYINDSRETAISIPDKSLDFVYVDAGHDYYSANIDIRVWWMKVKKEGLLCGHDFFNEPGVMKAVTEFAMQNGLLLQAKFPDWWLLKI